MINRIWKPKAVATKVEVEKKMAKRERSKKNRIISLYGMIVQCFDASRLQIKKKDNDFP